MHKTHNITFLGKSEFIKIFKELDYVFENFIVEYSVIDEKFVYDEDKTYVVNSNDFNLLSKTQSINKNNFFILRQKNETLNCPYKIDVPVSINVLVSKLKDLISSIKFKKNSSIHIKGYVLNKNTKSLIKNNKSIKLTEKEVQLIEVLFLKQIHLKKNDLAKLIWQYSDTTETHTIETHIYRLRQKIEENFDDKKFILNDINGYYL